MSRKHWTDRLTCGTCGKSFANYAQEAAHRHNFPVMCNAHRSAQAEKRKRYREAAKRRKIEREVEANLARQRLEIQEYGELSGRQRVLRTSLGGWTVPTIFLEAGKG